MLYSFTSERTHYLMTPVLVAIWPRGLCNAPQASTSLPLLDNTVELHHVLSADAKFCRMSTCSQWREVRTYIQIGRPFLKKTQAGVPSSLFMEYVGAADTWCDHLQFNFLVCHLARLLPIIRQEATGTINCCQIAWEKKKRRKKFLNINHNSIVWD